MSHVDPTSLYRAHASFVAGFLARLGTDRADLDDAVQEVFLVVHRKGGYEGGAAKPRTWLAEIAVRVASQLRRTRRRRGWETTGDEPERDERPDHHTPFEALDASRSLERVQRALDKLPIEQSAIFILFEIEGESCDSIAEGLAIPIGTVYSRLHTARTRFLDTYARLGADPARPRGSSPSTDREARS